MAIEVKEHERDIEIGDRVAGPTGVEGTVKDIKRDEGVGESDVLYVVFDNGLEHWRSETTVELEE